MMAMTSSKIAERIPKIAPRASTKAKGADPLVKMWEEVQRLEKEYYALAGKQDDAYDALPADAKNPVITLGITVPATRCYSEEQICHAYHIWIKAMEDMWGEKWKAEKKPLVENNIQTQIEEFRKLLSERKIKQDELGYTPIRKTAEKAEVAYNEKRAQFARTVAIGLDGLYAQMDALADWQNPGPAIIEDYEALVLTLRQGVKNLM